MNKKKTTYFFTGYLTLFPDGGKYRISLERAVIGSINGGGPEFNLQNFNGNIYIRKGK